MSDMNDHYLWSEKYRPAIVQDCILPKDIKKFFNQQIKAGQITNMLLSGPHGTGKTTAAKAMGAELGADVLFLNCSKERGIDVLRTKMTQFASTVSLTGKPKIIIADEFDYFTAEGQAAARGLIEEVSKSCRFIMTCNFPNKIIKPLRSRLTQQEFTLRKEDKPLLAKEFFIRCQGILKDEGVEYDNAVLAAFIRDNFPDYRKILSELQRAAMLGPIDESLLRKAQGSIDPYLKAIKAKDWKVARQFVGEMEIEASDFFTMVFKAIPDMYEDQKMAQAIIELNDHQYKHSFVSNPTLNLAALTIQLMMI